MKFSPLEGPCRSGHLLWRVIGSGARGRVGSGAYVQDGTHAPDRPCLSVDRNTRCIESFLDGVIPWAGGGMLVAASAFHNHFGSRDRRFRPSRSLVPGVELEPSHGFSQTDRYYHQRSGAKIAELVRSATHFPARSMRLISSHHPVSPRALSGTTCLLCDPGPTIARPAPEAKCQPDEQQPPQRGRHLKALGQSASGELAKSADLRPCERVRSCTHRMPGQFPFPWTRTRHPPPRRARLRRQTDQVLRRGLRR